MTVTFISEIPKALPDEFCKALINKFDQSQETYPGRTGGGVDTQLKDSTDLDLSITPHWAQEHELIQKVVFKSLVKYARQYPFLLAGPVSPTLGNADTGATHTLSYTDVQRLNDEQEENLLRIIYRLDGVNMQRYKKGQGGYHHWHSEHYPDMAPLDTPQSKQQLPLHRVLLWLIYLNDVNEGGETDFFFQRIRVRPTQGNLIFSPCGFTHTHRGSVPVSNDKYVLASWVMYNDAQTLYGL